MSAQSPSPDPSHAGAADAVVKPRRRISFVWIVPIVAALIGAWLAYKTISEKGPTITITFKTAEGLEQGKTKVKYREVEMGTVTAVAISDDLSHVIVEAEMDKGAAEHLTSTTRFWVVRPRLSLGGVSGLGTLVSGAFVEMEIGDKAGEPARTFVGLEDPPIVESDVPGTEFILQAPNLGSLNAGSPVAFRGIGVGEVIEYKLNPDGEGLRVRIFIRAPYDKFVRTNSTFWNASGISASMTAQGVRVRTESLIAILAGGVAFDTPATSTADPAPAETVYRLYQSFDSIREEQFAVSAGHKYLMLFDGSVRGLTVGAPVEFRGIKIGEVTSIHLEIDEKEMRINIPVMVEIHPDRFDLVNREDLSASERAKILVQRGLRAQLKSGNLITGALFVDVDFYPDAAPAEISIVGDLPQIPTIPTEIEELKRSVNEILNKLAALPLEGLVTDLQATVQSARALLDSPDLRQTATSLRKAAEAAEATLIEAQRAMASVEDVVGAESEARYDLVQMMRELSAAARSIRELANYLERHPEALIQGKGGP